jgi:hypothetical protein
MADTAETVTIRAELLNEAGPGIEHLQQQMRALGATVDRQSKESAVGVMELGARLDDLHVKGTKAASGGMTATSKAMKEANEQGAKLRETFSGIGESIRYRVQYPMQQLSYMIEGATAGIVTFGLTTQSSMQQATMALSSFTGSGSVGASVFAQLHDLQGPVPLSGLTTAFEGLSQAGMASGQIMPMLTALTNLSAVSLNPTNSFTTMASAIAQIQATGLINPSDVQAFSAAGVDIYGMLAKEMGTTPQELRTRFLRAGTPIATPGGFFSDLSSSQNATGGLSAYRKTWAGQFDEMKKSAGQLLGVFETPLGNALAGASTKLTAWSTATKGRFEQSGGLLGSEWSSGDMKGFGTTLAGIFGDPKLANDITMFVGDIRSVGQIISRDLIPAAHDVLTVATPAIHGLSDVLGFLADHTTTTETMLGLFAGFEVLSKVATWANAATGAIRALTAAMEEQGAAKGLSAFGGGALAGEGGIGGKLGALAGVVAGGGLAYQGTQGRPSIGSNLETVGGAALAGAAVGSVVPVIGTGIGALIGAGAGAGIDIFRDLRANRSSASTTVHIQPGAIQINGAQQPTAVANATVGAINDQIAAYNDQQTRRGG